MGKIFERLRVFVSSRMEELAPERQVIKQALGELKIDGWLFEEDAGAQSRSIQKTFLGELERADLYIGLFWKGWGDYTKEEYDYAQMEGKDCLIYEKRADLSGRDPRLGEFLDEIGDVETGHTIRWFETVDQLADFVQEDVQAWQASQIRERYTANIRKALSPVEVEDRRDLLILMRKVRQFWIEGVLASSVHGEAQIDLGKESHQEAVEHPWEQVVELPNQIGTTLPPDQPIIDTFESTGRSLLILGEPGSGKTVSLLSLCRDLEAVAQADPAEPIPVVLNLSSWTQTGHGLLEWLIEELQTKYQIPRRVGHPWLNNNRLVLLLDGLDEVRAEQRRACVHSINEFLQEYGASGLAVCCRLDEYTTLPIRLRLSGAILLQPLSTEQVEGYLSSSGDDLAGLREAWKHDPMLQTLAQSPLMIDIMTLAYRNASPETIGKTETIEDRQSHLFATYIRRMFERRGRSKPPFTSDRIMEGLSFLARGMSKHSQTVFLIEQLQPSWLAKQSQLLIYMIITRVALSLLFWLVVAVAWAIIKYNTMTYLTFGPFLQWTLLGVAMGIGGGLGMAIVDALRFKSSAETSKGYVSWGRIATVLTYAVAGLIGGLIAVFLGSVLKIAPVSYSLPVGLSCGVVWGVIWGLRTRIRRSTSDIRPVETIKFSWLGASKGVFYGFLLAICVGLATLIITGHSGFAMGLVFALATGPFGAVFGGLKTALIETSSSPNQGIKLSGRNAVYAGLVTSLLLAGGVGAMMALLGLTKNVQEAIDWGVYGMIIGISGGILASMYYGGQEVVQHYVLRLILQRGDLESRQIAQFLDYATKLIFLRKVGGGYIFIHRLLLEHFADMERQKDGDQ